MLLHIFSCLLNLFALYSDSNSSSKQRDKYLKNFYIVFPMFCSDILVLLTITNVCSYDLSTAMYALDIFWIFTFIWDYLHGHTLNTVGLLKGVASQQHDNMINLLYIKSLFSALIGIIGLVLCSLSSNLYIHYFICAYFLCIQFFNLIFATHMKSVLSKLNLVYIAGGPSQNSIKTTRKDMESAAATPGNVSSKISMDNAITEIKSQFTAAFVLTTVYSLISIPLLILFVDGSFNSDLVLSLPQKLVVGIGSLRLGILYIKKRDI